MRRGRTILAVAALAAAALSTMASSADTRNGASCSDTTGNPAHRHTAAGSCKDTDSWTISCATSGNVGPAPNGLRAFVTPTANGAEVEACNNSGDAITRGRAVVIVDRTNGIRFALDSDNANPQGGPGYIDAQVSTSNPTKSGVYCSADAGEAGYAGDGYARPWSDPGPEGGTSPQDCKPAFIPIP